MSKIRRMSATDMAHYHIYGGNAKRMVASTSPISASHYVGFVGRTLQLPAQTESVKTRSKAATRRKTSFFPVRFRRVIRSIYGAAAYSGVNNLESDLS
jgi:hypothetical protein